MAALGNKVVVKSRDNPIILEGYIVTGETPKPGTVMQIDTTAGLDANGRFTFEAFSRDADADRPKGPLCILLENNLEGEGLDVAYEAGQACSCHVPAAGEEFNMIFENQSGTGDDVAFGDILMTDSGTGKLLATSGSVESESWMSLGVLTDPMADAYLHVVYTGY